MLITAKMGTRQGVKRNRLRPTVERRLSKETEHAPLNPHLKAQTGKL